MVRYSSYLFALPVLYGTIDYYTAYQRETDQIARAGLFTIKCERPISVEILQQVGADMALRVYEPGKAEKHQDGRSDLALSRSIDVNVVSAIHST